MFLIVGASATVGIALVALNENLNLFYPPADVVGGVAPAGVSIRAGGMVAEQSLRHDAEGLGLTFVLTDHAGADFSVRYVGILPDLFREGQGVVANGRVRPDGVFEAVEILAKHDENYMPPEVADALKKAGKWKHAEGGAAPAAAAGGTGS